LALAVAIGHAGELWGYRLIDGQMAVQCFYMVSGFLISLILSGKYETSSASGLRLFYTNRALRIFVPYWIFFVPIAITQLIIGGAAYQLVSHWPEMDVGSRIYLALTNLFVVGQELQAWLSYDHGSLTWVWSIHGTSSAHLSQFMVIPPAWTLSLELMFYALAPFLVRRNWLVLVSMIAMTYAIRQLLMFYGLSGSGFIYRFFPVEIGLFLAGALAYRAFAFVSARAVVPLSGSIAVTTALLAMLFVIPYWGFWESHRFYLLVALALPSLFVVSRRFAFDRWLGELSYPIYLVHFGALVIGRALAARWLDIDNHDALSFALIAICVLIAMAYVRWIDTPFDKWRQQRVVGKLRDLPTEPIPVFAAEPTVRYRP